MRFWRTTACVHGLAGAGLTLLLHLGCAGRSLPDRESEAIRIGGHSFQLEIAADESSRTLGLMHRTEIAEGGGMLFVFPFADMRQFWMADCLVDIDLVFLDGVGRVTALHRMKALPPQGENESRSDYEARVRAAGGQYSSGFPAQFAIELRAGWLDRLDLHVQDKIELPVERLKALAR